MLDQNHGVSVGVIYSQEYVQAWLSATIDGTGPIGVFLAASQNSRRFQRQINCRLSTLE